MKIMADAINLSAVINEHNKEQMAFVEELIYYIDGILKDFRTAMRSRNTKRKNRKAVATAVMKLASLRREQRKLLPMGVGDSESETSKSVEKGSLLGLSIIPSSIGISEISR